MTPNVGVPAGSYADPRFVGYEDEDEYILFVEDIKSNYGADVAFITFERIYGKLILTNRRILFLSSGSGDGVGFLLDVLCGPFSLLNTVTQPERIDELRRNLDMSALARPSSWAVRLVSITKCEVSSTWYSGPFLRVGGRVNGLSREYVLYGPDHTREDLLDRQIRLEEAIRETQTANEFEQGAPVQ